MKRPALLLLLALLSGCVTANRAFYHPDHTIYATPRDSALSYDDVSFQSADGTLLSGWFVPSVGPAKGTIVHFHGNAQNMSAHFSLVSWIPSAGYNLFTFDYRGYGKSEGKPCRQGIYEDCVAAVAYVKQRNDVVPKRIILLGQSLGAANAIAVVGSGEHPDIAGVVADSPFSSYEDIARDRLRRCLDPLGTLLVSQAHSPIEVVGDISPIPLLLIHGTRDTVVPYYHSVRLREKAKEPVTLITIQDGEHIDALGTHREDMVPKLCQFFDGWLCNAN